MAGQRVGYVRVSTLDQRTDRQLDGLALDRVFTDKASGKDVVRSQLDGLLAFVQDGDTVVVHSIERHPMTKLGQRVGQVPDVGLQSPGEQFAGWETGWKRSGRAVAARSPHDAFVHGAVRLSDADAFSACCRSCGSLNRVSSCSPDSG
jgi:Resolvase, N terminal domain